MSAVLITAQEMSILYTAAYCGNAVSALLVYDWLLCLGQEVEFIWRRRPVVTVASVVYILSRYAMLVQYAVAFLTNFPMSDLRWWMVVNWMDINLCLFSLLTYSCTTTGWSVNVFEMLSMLAFSAFSALRAYALSNRNLWLTAMIFFLVFPPVSSYIIQCIYRRPINLPSPINCSALDWESPTLTLSVVSRATGLVAELVVISLSWWYSYRSYRISNDINLGKTISALLLYNGSVYFLFLATLYLFDVILHVASVPAAVMTVHDSLLTFYDPIISILVCRFMLSLRQFDARVASATNSGIGTQGREHTYSVPVLQFAAQASDSLPSFLASFAHPVHVELVLEDSGVALIDDVSELWRELDVVAPTPNLEDIIPPESCA